MKILVSTSVALVFALSAMPVTLALAADERGQTTTSGPSQGQGTPEDQVACNPDATRYCSNVMPDTFRVLACLQENRKKLRKVCQQVLENYGQ